MTSLNLAFEQFDDQMPSLSQELPPSQSPSKKQQGNLHYSPEIPQQSPQPSLQQSHQQSSSSTPLQQSQQIENFANYYNYQEQQRQSPNQYSRTPQYSFWDRMVMSRREVLKLFILSLVIILAISLEKIGCHYLYNYISSTDLTTFQEFLVRLSFPIVVFIILWIIKSL